MNLRVGNGAGFLGDNLDAPRLLAEHGRLDYLTLEYLAELTLSVLARQRQKNPSLGYAADLLTVLESLCPLLHEQPHLKLLTNGGGVNPLCCAVAAGRILTAAGLPELPIGVVTGDDLLAQLPVLLQDGALRHLDTGQTCHELPGTPVCANAYLGARPLVQALAAGARLVIAGRVADASLCLAPAVHVFGWNWHDWDLLAGASAAGHVIECGAQATGGYHPLWAEYRLEDVGYPIAELAPDGSAVITKPDGSGGAVTRETVAAQLVYEIEDPAQYFTPDVTVDFTAIELEEEGGDRVRLKGAQGRPPPERLKVSLAYEAGYMASGELLVFGPDCEARARACAELVWARLRRAGIELAETHVELLGTGAGVPGTGLTAHPPEVVLRLAVRDPRREAVERFTRELAPLATSGPPGLAGYTQARGSVRPVFAYLPLLVERGRVEPRVEVRTAAGWATADQAGH
ncbi:MAG: DUF1446 domain-containing protein [Pirellulales bacterium]|nr:DUF1446 domain-containing protein [Pirellulales bacterium]